MMAITERKNLSKILYEQDYYYRYIHMNVYIYLLVYIYTCINIRTYKNPPSTTPLTASFIRNMIIATCHSTFVVLFEH